MGLGFRVYKGLKLDGSGIALLVLRDLEMTRPYTI